MIKFPELIDAEDFCYVLESLDLSVRRWRCPVCHSEIDRDQNAAVNIKMVGASTMRVEDV
ncbi:MAG: transposase [Aphanocapsa sp. GSE-SYN-MK-11-07L]|jgi:putative transposase|nr:transposase [Aphanocapsa sp. GSE-SYN-MK-11-07L]